MTKIQNIQHHYFKFKFNDGWRIKFFSKESKLYRYIRNEKPLDSYISLNTFFNPKEVDTTKYPRVRKYNSVIDIDDTNKQNVLEILKRLKENNLKYEYILQTSLNSIQILLKGNKDKLLSEILKDLDVCPSTRFDVKRVIRLPFSNHHSSFETRFLNDKLDRFEGVPKNKIKQEKKIHEFYYKFLRPRTDGIRFNDRSVLYYKSKFLNLNRVKYLQHKYNLNDCYILFYEKEKEPYGFLYCKSIQNSQLIKIQKARPNIRISKKRNGEIILAPKPKLLKIVESKVNNGPISFTHMNWLRTKMGVTKNYKNEIGKENTGFVGHWRG